MIKLLRDWYAFLKIKKMVSESGLFDEVFYLEQNPDVAVSDQNALKHYCKYGIYEGRSPSTLFDPLKYLQKYEDVRKEGINPMLHYLIHGIKENREFGFEKKPSNSLSFKEEKISKFFASNRQGLDKGRHTDQEVFFILKKELEDLENSCSIINWNKVTKRHGVNPSQTTIGRGFFEMVFYVPTSGCLFISGWTYTTYLNQLWIEVDGKEAYSLENVFRYYRKDVEDHYGDEIDQPHSKNGFVACLPLKYAPSVLELKQISVLGSDVLYRTQDIIVLEQMKPLLTFLFGINMSVTECIDRIKKVDINIIQPMIEAQVKLNKRSPYKLQCFGETGRDLSLVIPIYATLKFWELQMMEFSKDAFIKNHTEIIYVLDDPSLQDDAEWLAMKLYKMYKVPFKLVISSINRGFSGANNVGYAVSNSECLLFMNSDVLPIENGWCQQILKTFETYSDVGAVGVRLLYGDGSIQHAGMKQVFNEKLGLWLNHHHLSGLAKALDPNKAINRVDAVTGAFIAIKREDFDEIGGWDESYLVGDFEDSDICNKLKEHGKKILYNPEIELTHLERQSFAKVGSGMYRQNIVYYNAIRHQNKWKKEFF